MLDQKVTPKGRKVNIVNVISKHTCEVFTYTRVALKGLHTKAQHEKCFIQFMFFTIQGSLLRGIFPDQTGTEIWKK